MNDSDLHPSAVQTGSRRFWLSLFCIVVATVAAYSASFNGPFIFDDSTSIPSNPYIRKLWPLTEAMQSPERASVAGRPLVSYSFAINYAISGYDVWSYHAGNLLIHLLNAFLVFALIRRTLDLPSVQSWLREHAQLLAWAVAVLWAVHPINSETVIYVVQRTELMVSTLMLLGFLALQRSSQSTPDPEPRRNTSRTPSDPWASGVSIASADKSARGSRPSRIWQVWVVVCVVFGLLCKELAAVMPFLLLIYDRAFLSVSWKQVFARRWLMYLALVPTWALAGWLAIEGHRGGLGEGDPSLYWRYPLTQGGVILWYIRLLFFPYPLAITYHWPMVDGVVDSLPASAIVLVLLLGTFYALWRYPKIGFLGACFFFILAPTSSFIPIMTEVVGERRMYLPSLAIIIPVLIAGLMLIQRVVGPRSESKGISTALVSAVLSLAFAAGITTYVRSHDFDTEVKIWEQTVRVQPQSPMALNNLAAQYINMQRLREAEELLNQVERISPNFGLLPMNWGMVRFYEGDYQQAARYFEQAVKYDPTMADVFAYAGLSYGMIDETEKSQEMLSKALEIDPANRMAGNFLGLLLDKQGHPEAAVAALNDVVDRYKDFPAAHANLAVILDRLGNTQEARFHFQRAYESNPESIEVLQNYGAFEARQHNWFEAERLYKEAIAQNSLHKEALLALAAIYRQTERFKQSDDIYRPLLRKFPSDPILHNNYGILLVAMERYEEAYDHFATAVHYDPNYKDAKKNLELTRIGLKQIADEKAAKEAPAEQVEGLKEIDSEQIPAAVEGPGVVGGG